MTKATVPGRTDAEVLADINAQLFLKVSRLGLNTDGVWTRFHMIYSVSVLAVDALVAINIHLVTFSDN